MTMHWLAVAALLILIAFASLLVYGIANTRKRSSRAKAFATVATRRLYQQGPRRNTAA